jgi:hypothetical protein
MRYLLIRVHYFKIRKLIPMSEENGELPQIELTYDKTEISKHSHVYISVKGFTLEECRKHFDELKKEVIR